MVVVRKGGGRVPGSHPCVEDLPQVAALLKPPRIRRTASRSLHRRNRQGRFRQGTVGSGCLVDSRICGAMMKASAQLQGSWRQHLTLGLCAAKAAENVGGLCAEVQAVDVAQLPCAPERAGVDQPALRRPRHCGAVTSEAVHGTGSEGKRRRFKTAWRCTQPGRGQAPHLEEARMSPTLPVGCPQSPAPVGRPPRGRRCTAGMATAGDWHACAGGGCAVAYR